MLNEHDEKEMTPDKHFVTWNEFDNFIQVLGEKLDMTQFTGVYGPARGGLVFAVSISHKYNLPFLGAPQKGCLCVDDICDTGDTALAWCHKGYTIASMFYKKGSKVVPDYWMTEKQDKWIVFPWE